MKDLHAERKSAWADTLPSQWGPELAKIEIPLEGHPEPGLPPQAMQSAPSAAVAATRLPLMRWLVEGLRATLFFRPRTGASAPTPWQLIVVVLLSTALMLGMARLEVVGPAQFNLRNWLTPLWTGLVLLWLGWWAMAPAQSRPPSDGHALSGGVAAWYVLSTWAPLLPTLVLYGLLATVTHKPSLWASEAAGIAFWVIYGLLTVWLVAALVVVSGRFIRSAARTAVYAAGLVGVIALGTWQFPDRPWEFDAEAARAKAAALGEAGEAAPEPVRLALSQAVFEAQQPLLEQRLQALAPERAGVVDVYGLVFAPYAGEEVFRRESTMVSTLLQERFDAQGRVIHLLNHAETASTHAWATPQNLQRAIAGLAQRMDRDNDLLVIYMTSHGARNHELAAAHWPLQVSPATPEMLRAALDEAGIRNRVIAVSACYSGGWIDPLVTDSTLIMTAADATHTSYGCGTRSELTFFGRAVFNEQLRQTHSFSQAFEKAVPLIAEREIEAGKSDGFSNPQIRVGTQIAPVLQSLEQRLAATPGDSVPVATSAR
ncbi:MAG: C13 family peptidase [Gammaproteobacteria bacterium]|nr:C13 family peptidase [Gammaproteobacteria bacterium]